MSRQVYTLDLSPRENVRVSESNGRYVWNAIGYAVLALLGYVIVVLVMT